MPLSAALTDRPEHTFAEMSSNLSGIRSLSAVSLVLGMLATLGSLLLYVRLLVPGATPLPTVTWPMIGTFLVLSAPAGAPAIVIGALALVRKRPGRVMAIAGLVLGSAGVVLWCIAVVGFIIRTPI